MDKKQVLIVSLLVVAIILSTVSIVLNVSLMDEVKTSYGIEGEPNANVAIEVLPTINNGNGGQNGL